MAIRITRAGVGLTIGIIIVALVMLGGLYFAKQRGEQARRDEAVKIAQQNLESESQGTEALNEGDDAAEGSGQNNDTETGGSGSDVATTDELPQTGMDDVMPIVAIALLTFAGASYVSSRRALPEVR